MSSTLLTQIKASQRVTNTLVNEDYQDLIDVCKSELLRLGVSAEMVEAEGTEVTQACKLYVHWMTDYQGKGALWGEAYVAYVNGIRTHEYPEANENV